MFNLNPKKMQAMMRQMGISQEEIDASRVIIEKQDNSKTIIENPSVTKITMQGQDSFQVSGEIREESTEDAEENISDASKSEEDIKTIMEKTNCSEKEAKKALEETGDLAEAILKLSK
jgi:nascent polypeptide-associated complex subunit alpha